MNILKNAFLICMLVLLTSCQSNLEKSPRYISTVDEDIQEQIAIDLFGLIHKKLDLKQMPLTLVPSNVGEERLKELLNTIGSEIRTTGSVNTLTFDVYFLDETNTYIGIITIANFKKYSRQYESLPEGLVQIGETTIGG